MQKELSETIYDWLTQKGIKVSKDYCKQEITAHPDYPAMTAAIDFLESGGMEYEAVKADATHIQEFNYPLVAHIKKPGNEYLRIVKNVSTWDLEKDIIKDWSGIVVFPQNDTKWQNEENNTAIRTNRKNHNLFIVWCAIGIVLFSASVYFRPGFLFNFFGFFSFAGVFISLAAFATELGIQSAAVKQVCGTVSKGGCEGVLRSRFAKGIFGISPADAAVIYFVGQFIVYLIATVYIPAFSILPYVALAGIGIAALSIYTQAFVLKQWCALCIGIATVLTLQAVISLFVLKQLNSISGIVLIATFALVSASVIQVKALLKNITEAKHKLAELKNWKTDARLFLTQLEKEEAVNTTPWEKDLILGDDNAPIKITVACNPYCKPCARAHKKLDEILEKYPETICVLMRFACDPLDQKDKGTDILRTVLQISNSSEKALMRRSISEWFNEMDYFKWQEKWQPNNRSDVQTNLEKHSTWFIQNNIRTTPTFYINGRKMPGRYTIYDFEKLIPQLNELIPQLS